MDFRMEKSSYAMLVFIFATLCYYTYVGAGTDVNAIGFLKIFGYALLVLIALIALACIPVLLYCYVVKKIPDIDYSINLAFAATIIGIISEII
ncbi:MAG: hypothetical protein RLZZ546_2983 [Bacteroidota bacterium]|jgi:hypothetical protein